MRAVALGLILPCLLCCTSAEADFYNGPAQGWLNYNYAPPVPPSKQKPLTPSQKMDAFHAYFENVKDEALEDPTEQNVDAYITLQGAIQNSAIAYQQSWQKDLLDHPQHNYELTHPTDSIANQIHSQATQQQQVAAVKAFAQSYGLVYFYYGSDAYAKSMAPSLQSFADQYGIALLGISMDGNMLSAISDNETNKSQAYRLHVQYFPALYLVNPSTGNALPVAYGFLAQDQLLQRFYDLETNFSGQNLMTGG